MKIIAIGFSLLFVSQFLWFVKQIMNHRKYMAARVPGSIDALFMSQKKQIRLLPEVEERNAAAIDWNNI